MANKTVSQLATLSGIATDDLIPVYDASELGIEKLKKVPYSDLKSETISGLSVEGHSHGESDITDLDKYTQTEVNNRISTVSGVLQDDIDSKSDLSHDHDSDYAQLSSVNTFLNNQVIANNKGLYIKDTGAANRPMLVVNDSDQAEIGHVVFPLEINTNGTLTHNGNAILTTADEGSGNGIDADTLDGNEAAAFAAAAHTHDDRYYTENEMGSLLADKSDTSHEHDTLEYSGNKSIEASSAGVNIYEPATPANFGGFGFSGNELYIGNKTTSASVHLYGKNSGDATVNIVHGDPDGATEIYHAGVKTLRTNESGVNIYDASGSYPALTLNSDSDNRLALIYNNGSHTYIENEVHGGNLYLDSEDSSGSVKHLFAGNSDGATEIYYAGNKKLETASNGIKTFGHILPDMTTGASGTVSAHDIGSPTAKIRNIYAHDAYIDAGSLYVNEKKVIEDVSDIITVSTDVDNDIRVKATGQGIVYLNSEDEIDMHADGGIQVEVPSTLSTKHMNFTNMSTNGNITFSADGTGAQVQLSATEEIDLTATNVDVNGNMDVSGTFTASNFDGTKLKYGGNTKIEAVETGANVTGNLTIAGDFTVSGTTTTVDSQELTVTDKTITVNNGEVGAGLTGGTQAGIIVDRGSETNYTFIFDETQDNFRVGETGSEQAVATREDSPTDMYVPVWDAVNFQFSTASGLDVSTILTTADEGSGNGLDADTLDGNEATAFAAASHSHDTINYGSNTSMSVYDSGLTKTATLKINNTNYLFFSPNGDQLMIGPSTDNYEIAPFAGTHTITLGSSEVGQFSSGGLQLGGSGATISTFSTDTTFASATDTEVATKAAVKSYVDANAGSGGGVGYVHTQASGTTSWVVTHNLGQQFVNVEVADANDLSIIPDEISFDSINQTTITFLAAESGHAVIGGGNTTVSGIQSWAAVTSNTTAVHGNRMLVDTSSATITITMPASPSVGDELWVVDAAVNFGTNNCTLGRNSSNIEGVAEDYVLDLDRADVHAIYVGSAIGWRISNV
jgi:hypothetical protein